MRRPTSLSLLAGVGAVALVLAGAASSASTAATPIRVGFLAPLTGVAAANGQSEVAGWKLGVKDIGGQVDGHKIVTYYVDTAGDPSTGLTGARALIDNRHVDVLIGPLLANVGLAVGNLVKSTGTPALYISACPTEFATKDKVSNLILTGWTCDQPTLNFGKYVYKTLGYHHVTTIGADYAFGWQVIGGFVKSFERAGGKIDKQIWFPITTTDFSSFVTSIPKNTDAVFCLAFGAGAVRFTQAYQQFGLKKSIPLIGGGTLTDYSALQSEKPNTVLGVITALQYADGLKTPANTKFAREFHAANHTYPSYYAESAYTAAKLLSASLKRLNGDASDHAKVVKMLKTTPIVSPRGPVKINPTTNSPIQNIYIRKVEKVNGALRNVVIATVKNSQPWGPFTKAQWLKFATKYSH